MVDKLDLLKEAHTPNSAIGKTGDKKGNIATDGTYIYVASADYDGTTNIWFRASLSSW